ncbi:Frigida-like [Arabidopsis thaliana x Arabidopsis arenosa]|uniref:FRIGIDA-like protein n=1 Tax=Arabidopsis thaliana x Arabidopsis arenosa TaxID=1240361 RepID=A0A8T2C929_9BRAS|nr:Frigida-like [Arabidopsis thaliana x Arabidopsis arenosa]
MNGVSRYLRASSLPSLIRSYGGINLVRRFSSQSDGFSGGRFREQGPVPGDSANNSGLPNTGRIGSPSEPNPSTLRTFGDMKAGLLNRGVNGFSAPNAPPTFKNSLRSRLPNSLPDQFSQTNPGLPNTGGSGFSAPSVSSYENFTQSSLLNENPRSGGKSSDLDFVREVIEDEGRRTSGIFSHFHRPNLETNADIIHIKMLRNNTFVTVTDSKGNVKCKATSGSLPDLKGGRKMTNYTADATAENIGRRAKAMGLKSVVVKVNGFTHFGKKKKAIVAFRDGFTNSRSDQNPIVYIEDTTRKAHNEALIEINANLTNDLRERARTLAYDWKPNIGNKPSEALGFLHLVAAFELGSLFSNEELCDYVFLISKYKQATTICRKIGLDRNRIGLLVQKFLDTGRLLVAIKFIYEFEMTGEFEPVSILKTSLKNSREAAKRVCAEGNYSLKVQNEATDKELSALRAVIKVVKEKNIESEFSEEKLEECVKELEDQKAHRKRATKLNSPANPQQPQQQKVDNKRPRVANGSSMEYNLIVPPLSQQQPLLPNPSQSLQVNPYGLLNSMLPGVAVPYGNPLALYGSVPAPRPVFYEQQTGNGGYGMPPPHYLPPYYPQ